MNCCCPTSQPRRRHDGHGCSARHQTQTPHQIKPCKIPETFRRALHGVLEKHTGKLKTTPALFPPIAEPVRLPSAVRASRSKARPFFTAKNEVEVLRLGDAGLSLLRVHTVYTSRCFEVQSFRAFLGCYCLNTPYACDQSRLWPPLPDDPPTGVPFLLGAVCFARDPETRALEATR